MQSILDGGFMYKLNILDKISLLLVIIGALNWGLYGLFNLDLVKLVFSDLFNLLFGTETQLAARIVYILVGIAGLNLILSALKLKKRKI
jgi:uncharacterized membrane protein YuzA (DUF378 family)